MCIKWFAVISDEPNYWDDGPGVVIGPYNTFVAALDAGERYVLKRPDHRGEYKTFTAVPCVSE